MKKIRILKTLMVSGAFCGAMTFGLVQKTHASLMGNGFETTPAENSALNHNLTGWSPADYNHVGMNSQTSFGLTVDGTYEVSFYRAPQSIFTGVTIKHWQEQALAYTANNTTRVSSFLAVGNSNGQSSFSMNDSVAMTAVPEPTTIVAGALMIIPFGVSTVRILRRKARA